VAPRPASPHTTATLTRHVLQPQPLSVSGRRLAIQSVARRRLMRSALADAARADVESATQLAQQPTGMNTYT